MPPPPPFPLSRLFADSKKVRDDSYIIKTTQPLSAGLLVTWNIFVYQGDPKRTLGLAYDDVRIPSELGPLPAWLVPGERPTWILLVHGFHATREEGLRGMASTTRAHHLYARLRDRGEI